MVRVYICHGDGGVTDRYWLTSAVAVIAVDICPERVELARFNAGVYGVQERIQFVVGDFLQLAPRLRADAVFLSPPWGGESRSADGCVGVRTLGWVNR